MSADWMDDLTEDGKEVKVAGKHTPAPAIGNQVTIAQAEKATGGKDDKDGRYHGNYRQITMRLRPEVAREIEDWARRLNVNNAALQRYVIWRGLRALQEGERPELSQRVEMREY